MSYYYTKPKIASNEDELDHIVDLTIRVVDGHGRIYELKYYPDLWRKFGTNILRNIEVRTYDPDGEDMLFGFCHWTGVELVSGDGDSYYLDDPITKYEFDEQTHSLTYWFKGVWL